MTRNRLSLSRRAMILGGVGVAAAAGAGTVLLTTDQGHIRRTLRRLVGPFKMDKAEFETFVRDFREAEAAPSFIKSATLRGLELIGLGSTVSGGGIPKLSDHQADFERALLTAFIVRTDYTLLDQPATEPTTYLGSMTACFNPYAEFA
ncbi:MAG TPA: hypothetical protein DHU81_09820 [Hyphomonas sp.]|nr:hypothetical protein [Hyphomonas sp.]